MSLTTNATRYLIPTLAFMLPLLFIPFFALFHETPKLILITTTTIVLLFLSSLSTLTTHKLTLPSSPASLTLFSIIIFTLITLLANPEGQIESIFGKGALLLSLSLLSFLILSHPRPRNLLNLTSIAIVGSSSIVAVFGLLQLLFFYNLTSLPVFMQTRLFTLTGSPLSTLIFLLIGAGVSLGSALIFSKWRVIGMLSSALNLVAATSYLALMLPSQQLSPIILPFSATWSIFLDTAKSLRDLAFGVGLSNFPPIFTAVKPLFLNNTQFWNILPQEGSSEFLTLAITGGIPLTLSLLGFAAVVFAHFKTLDKETLPLKIGFSLVFLTLLLAPDSLLTLSMFFIFGSLLLSSLTTTHSLTLSHPYLRLGIVGGVFFLCFFVGYYTIQFARASAATYQSQRAILAGQGQPVYDQALLAVKLMPHITAYRVSYSQINLNLASAISKNTTTPTDQERSQIAQLVSQAIREGKAATTLRPSFSTNWQNLGNIYRNLVGIAEGADTFTLEAYAIAIAKDPGNPILRVEYGGVLQQLSATAKSDSDKTALLSSAENEFLTAIRLRPTYSNAYYNLSRVYKSLGDQAKAIAALEQTLTHLGTSSPEYPTAKNELDNLKKEATTPATTTKMVEDPKADDLGELTEPAPLPTPLEEPITIQSDN